MPWLVPALIVLNIPVYFLIGWILFDSKETAAETFFGTLLAILRVAFVPPIIRVMLGWDDTDTMGVFPILGFFIACIAVVAAEVWLLAKFGLIEMPTMGCLILG